MIWDDVEAGGGWCKGTLMVRRRSVDCGRSRIRVRRMAVEVGSGWVVGRWVDGGVAVASRERVGVGDLRIR